jgi:hypothetical protein
MDKWHCVKSRPIVAVKVTPEIVKRCADREGARVDLLPWLRLRHFKYSDWLFRAGPVGRKRQQRAFPQVPWILKNDNKATTAQAGRTYLT